MADVLHVDGEARLIRLQAGARLSHLHDVLARHGLAFDNFGSIVDQTAAGYIATGSHGTGARTRILSAHVQAIRLVDGRGDVHDLDETRDPELFSAARVNLGCLGVVTEITIRCVEAYDLEGRLELVAFDSVLANLDRTLRENEYCKLWWLPYTDEVRVYTFNKTTRPRTGFDVPGFLDATGVSGVFFNALIGFGGAVPAAIPPIHAAVQKIHFRPHRRVDRSDRITRVGSSIPIHQDMEYAIPISSAARAIDETRKLILKSRAKANLPMEVRFVAADDIPMSPTNGRDSCYIGPYLSSRTWAPVIFGEFEAMIRD